MAYRSTTVLLELPVSVIERTHRSGLQPSRDAVEMESVIANAPGYGTFFAGSGSMISLALNACVSLLVKHVDEKQYRYVLTEIHDVVATDCTVVNHNVPCPKSYGVPLLDFEFLLAFFALFLGCIELLGRCRSITHLHVRHVCSCAVLLLAGDRYQSRSRADSLATSGGCNRIDSARVPCLNATKCAEAVPKDRG